MSQVQEHEWAQLLPTKDALTALKSDVTLESAILELCDNALDAWERSNGRREQATIRISVDADRTPARLTIHDNTGGVPRSEASMLFGLGRTAKQNGKSIGAFGVGAKKSLVNLGVPFTIKSRHPDDETGWEYQITEEWFNNDEDWSVPIYSTNEIPPGITEITIHELNYGWDEETDENLRKSLGSAYNLFLSPEMQELCGTDFDLSIIVNGETVEAEGIPDWSFSPFDGLYPRRYENIQLDFDHLESPVSLHITAGLLRKKDTHTAGTDIYCQKRKVVSCCRDSVGGFGKGTERLGHFNARHERLKVIVELETIADGQQLPWDTQKSSIDKHNLIMRGTEATRGVYNWLRRTVQAYYELDADKVPQAILEPYAASTTVAVNGGQVEKYDYEGRQRVGTRHRPNTDLSEISTLRRKAEAHAVLLIRSPQALVEAERPAYRIQLDRESERGIEHLHEVTEDPPETVLKDAHRVAGRVNELARIHLEKGIRFTDGLEPWQRPRYTDYFDKHGIDSVAALTEPPDDLPVSPSELKGDDDSTPVSKNGPVARSSQTVTREQSRSELAELFLVFSDNDDEERVAKVLDLPRSKLSASLDLPVDAGDDVLWEEIRYHLDRSLS